ncbi:glycosyltransferase family 2 protein [Pontibacterium sp.]|uniref:glycosyltransferase family 2 protein n=1 Tax=Pontibacterium sp. TaxID=2036026 RepID=UPI00356AC907
MNAEKDSSCLVSIIMVSYNTADLTIEAIQSVIDQTTIDYELIVLDNDSPDGSYEKIKSRFDGIKLIKSEDNLGFALANNVAIEEAKGEYVLLLNPDTVVLEDAIGQLLFFAQQNPKAKIWGGRTLHGDHSLNPKSCYRKLNTWSIFCRTAGLTGIFPNSELFNHEEYGGWLRDHERQVDIVVGCFFMIKREDWNLMGGFDKAFFMYCEEADLCLRATIEIDARPMVTPDATIIHYCGASDTVRADKMVRLLKATLLLVHKHSPKYLRGLNVFLLSLWPFSRMLAYKTAHLISKSEKHQSSYGVWKEIWSRRTSWKNV